MCPNQATFFSKGMKSVEPPIIEMHLSEGVRESVSQSVDNTVEKKIFFFKFFINLLEEFFAASRTFLD